MTDMCRKGCCGVWQGNCCCIETPINVRGIVGLMPRTQVGLTPGTQVGLTPGTQVDLTPGTQVDLTPGTQVDLTPGAQVGLAPGTQVGLALGTQVGLTPGSKVEITMSPDYYEADIFNALQPLTNYEITANGTYYTSEIDVSRYQSFSFFIENDIQSAATSVTTSIEYSQRPGNVSYWTSNYVTDPYRNNAAITEDELAPGTAIIYMGKPAVRYARVRITVTGLNTGTSVILRGIFQGKYYN